MPDQAQQSQRPTPPAVNPRPRLDVAAVRLAMRRTGGRLKKRATRPRLRQSG